MFNRGPETVRVGRVKVLNLGAGMARVTKKDTKREEKRSEDKVCILQQRDMLRLLERQLKA